WVDGETSRRWYHGRGAGLVFPTPGRHNLIRSPTERARERSEVELHYQHHRPRRAHRGRDLSEGVRGIDVTRGRPETGGVGQVERLGAELEIAVCPGVEALADGRVVLAIRRPPPHADAAVAPGAEGCALERADVQPLEDRLVGGHGVSDTVGPF